MIAEPVLDCPIIGFELTGDELLEGEFIPLKQGLTVFYGLNGAGKTRLLRGIRSALTGERSDVELGVVVGLDHEDHQERWLSDFTPRRSIRIAIAQAIGASTVQGAAGSSEMGSFEEDRRAPWDERSMTSAEADDIIRKYIRELAGETDPAVTAEILESRCFLLIPTGTRKHPAWDAWPVADTSRPATSRQLSRLQAAGSAFDAGVPAGLRPEDYADNATVAKLRAELLDPFDPLALIQDGSPRARGRQAVEPTHYSFYAAGHSQIIRMRGLELRGQIDLGISVWDLDGDAESATRVHLASATRLDAAISELIAEREPEIAMNHRETSERRILESVFELSRRADELLQKALPGTPAIRLYVRPRNLMFGGPAVEWQVGEQALGLEDLSRAEVIWARRAINQAVYENLDHLLKDMMPLIDTHPNRPRVTLLDEPEAALHRSAEAHMSEFLSELSANTRQCVIVATHSPHLLDSSAAHTIEVRRAVPVGSAKSRVQQLGVPDREDLARLGLRPSDLLSFTRVFLLVEGVHDEAALRAFFDERLRRAQVEIITLSGAKNLKRTLENEVLYKFTDARVVAMLDNIQMAEVEPVWAEAIQLAETAGPQRAADYIFSTLPRTDEIGALRSWLGTALGRGYHRRVAPFGLQARDVLEYFPAGAFTARSETWDELREIRAVEDGTPVSAGGLKEWIGRRFGTDFSGAAVEIAIASEAPRMEIPQEFRTLMALLEAGGQPNGH